MTALSRSPALLGIVRHLLAREEAHGSASAEPAGQFYSGVQTSLSPLLGSACIQALLLRSAKLVRDEFPWLAEIGVVDSAAKLRASLCTREPAEAERAAEALFGTFLTLVATFVGERLTIQALRSSWPALSWREPSSAVT